MPEYRLRTRATFSASHELRGYPGDCRRVHGHNWGVVVEAAVSELDGIGMGVDFRVLRGCIEKAVAGLDHRHLNDLEPFLEANPTAERIARHLFRLLKGTLPDGVRLVEVRVEETDRDWAAYRE